MEQLDDLLVGMDVILTDELLDRIDEIVPPGTNVGTLDQTTCHLPSSDRTSRRPSMDGPLEPISITEGVLLCDGPELPVAGIGVSKQSRSICAAYRR